MIAKSLPMRRGAPQQVGDDVWKAVNAALEAELDSRPEMLVYGEDVGFAGRDTSDVTRNLQKKFGESRVFDTPVAESAILGSAVGAAVSGIEAGR